jgi:hypothetical protein
MKNLRAITLLATGLAAIAPVIGYCCSAHFSGGWFFLFLLLNPSVYIINAVIALKLKCNAAQMCLLAAVGICAIGTVVTYALLPWVKDSFAIGLLTFGGGALAIGVMIPPWLTAFIMEGIVNAPVAEEV